MNELGIYVPFGIYCFTLAIELLSVFLVYRQRATSYPSVRTSLLAVYLISILILVLEFVRLFTSSTDYMRFYAASGLTLLLLVVIFLTLAALAIYLRPKQGGNYDDLFQDIIRRKRESIIFFAFLAFVLYTAYYIDFFQPYTITTADDLFGNQILTVTYSAEAFALLGGVLVFFMAYPSPLFFLTARKIANEQVKRNLMILPLCWIGIGVDLFVFNGYLTAHNISANAIIYLIWGGLFSITAVVFSNASTVSSFFSLSTRQRSGRAVASQVTVSKHPFSDRLAKNQDVMTQLGNSILFEVDPSVKYEDAVQDFASELISNDYVVFVFTSKGSPIFSSLSKNLKEARFYLLTASVSYVKPTAEPYHMLIPQSDFAVMLDAVTRTSELASSAKIGLIFDNLSDMITNSDFESAYKFLKRQNEAVSNPSVTKLFLIIKGAQDSKQVNLIRSVFPTQISSSPGGIKREK